MPPSTNSSSGELLQDRLEDSCVYKYKGMFTAQDRLDELEIGFFKEDNKIYCRVKGKEALLVEISTPVNKQSWCDVLSVLDSSTTKKTEVKAEVQKSCQIEPETLNQGKSDEETETKSPEQAAKEIISRMLDFASKKDYIPINAETWSDWFNKWKIGRDIKGWCSIGAKKWSDRLNMGYKWASVIYSPFVKNGSKIFASVVELISALFTSMPSWLVEISRSIICGPCYSVFEILSSVLSIVNIGNYILRFWTLFKERNEDFLNLLKMGLRQKQAQIVVFDVWLESGELSRLDITNKKNLREIFCKLLAKGGVDIDEKKLISEGNSILDEAERTQLCAMCPSNLKLFVNQVVLARETFEVWLKSKVNRTLDGAKREKLRTIYYSFLATSKDIDKLKEAYKAENIKNTRSLQQAFLSDKVGSESDQDTLVSGWIQWKSRWGARKLMLSSSIITGGSYLIRGLTSSARFIAALLGVAAIVGIAFSAVCITLTAIAVAINLYISFHRYFDIIYGRDADGKKFHEDIAKKLGKKNWSALTAGEKRRERAKAFVTQGTFGEVMGSMGAIATGIVFVTLIMAGITGPIGAIPCSIIAAICGLIYFYSYRKINNKRDSNVSRTACGNSTATPTADGGDVQKSYKLRPEIARKIAALHVSANRVFQGPTRVEVESPKPSRSTSPEVQVAKETETGEKVRLLGDPVDPANGAKDSFSTARRRVGFFFDDNRMIPCTAKERYRSELTEFQMKQQDSKYGSQDVPPPADGLCTLKC